MKFPSLRSLFPQAKPRQVAENKVIKDARGVREIFESQVPSPKIPDEIALFRIQIPDLLAEQLTAEHAKKIGDLQGIAADEAIFILDLMSVCHTGNPLFTINSLAITYNAKPDNAALNISIDGDYKNAIGAAPSEHFSNLLARLKKTLDVTKGWGYRSLKPTLAEFLPKQGNGFTSLSVGTLLRQSQRKLLSGHFDNNVNLTSYLDNPEHMITECLFPSGFNYQQVNGLDETLVGYAISRFYKLPTAGGYSGLNACVAAAEFVTALHSNRCLYSFPNTYHLTDETIWLTSGLSKLFYAETPIRNSVSGENSKRIVNLVEEAVKTAPIYAKLPAHRFKFDLIDQWADLAQDMVIKKQIQRFFGLLGNGQLTLCPLTAVEDKRLALHESWVQSRSEQH
jgi:hypothetical protein